jgi:hypothetical protein
MVEAELAIASPRAPVARRALVLVNTAPAMPLMAPRWAPTMAPPPTTTRLVGALPARLATASPRAPLPAYLRSAPALRLRQLQEQPRGVPAQGHRARLCRRDRAGFADQ